MIIAYKVTKEIFLRTCIKMYPASSWPASGRECQVGMRQVASSHIFELKHYLLFQETQRLQASHDNLLVN